MRWGGFLSPSVVADVEAFTKTPPDDTDNSSFSSQDKLHKKELFKNDLSVVLRLTAFLEKP